MIALREISGTMGSSTLYYLHADHLGSTSLVTNASGGVVSRQGHYAYGAPRNTQGTLPTDKTFTGQRAETGLGSLMDFVARPYSPLLGRFLQADTIVPGAGNPQALNRYMFVLGNPVKYTDPTGQYRYDAIRDYLVNTYGEELGLSYLGLWQADASWWAMLSDAQSGDFLFGGDGYGFVYMFLGSGKDILWGIQNLTGTSGYSLVDLQRGYGMLNYKGRDGSNQQSYVPCEWVGTIRMNDNGGYELRNPRYTKREYSPTSIDRHIAESASALMEIPLSYYLGIGLGITKVLPQLAFALSTDLASIWLTSNWREDALDIEEGDMNVHIGPAYFNLQRHIVGDQVLYTIEHYYYGDNIVNAWWH